MVNDLCFITPEAAGLPSEKVSAFIARMKEYRVNLHSFMLVKDGNILTEAYYKPFDKDFAHRIYSSSKTYAAIAVGLLVGEGKVKLTDRLSDYFPELIDNDLHKWMKECTVEDALKMSVPMNNDTYFARDYKEWAWTFFSHPERAKAVKPGGTIFHYNTSGSFILDVLVEKVTGKPFLEYMRPVFDKIGVSKDIWCVKAPDGYSWGGSGVVCTLRDFAKFGELLLYRGEYKGEQILPRDYMEKATSKQICNLRENTFSLRKGWGYGYQIWMVKDGFGMFGMGSQFAFMFPEKNFMFVCQGDTQCDADWAGEFIFDAVYHILYENVGKTALPENSVAQKKLEKELEGLALLTEYGKKDSRFEGIIDGRKYRLEENPMGWKWFSFRFDGGKSVLTYENKRGVKNIYFGLNEYAQATFPETHYYDKQVDVPANRELDCMAAASWTEEKKLLLRVYITDTSFGNCFMTFGFKGEGCEEVGIMMNKRAEFFMDDYVGFAGGYKVESSKK